jgi:hypothetical protein
MPIRIPPKAREPAEKKASGAWVPKASPQLNRWKEDAVLSTLLALEKFPSTEAAEEEAEEEDGAGIRFGISAASSDVASVVNPGITENRNIAARDRKNMATEPKGIGLKGRKTKVTWYHEVSEVSQADASLKNLAWRTKSQD